MDSIPMDIPDRNGRRIQKQNSPYNQLLKLTIWTICVRRMRLELTRRNRHYPLKVACLPIPPPAREKVPRTGLEPACLSTHAPETCASTNSATWAYTTERYRWSEKRDSNPRPQPWQGCALPTELFSQLRVQR